jgi:hypothetical protein
MTRVLLVLALLAAGAGRLLPGPALTTPTPVLARSSLEQEGIPAPAQTVRELQATLDDAIRRFEAMDGPGVLRHVSDQYHTSPFTKAGLGKQLQTLFAVHEQVRARVRIDAVRMVGGHAWVFSTGEVTGRVRWVGTNVPILAWERELEVARREAGGWRLFGYQQ